MPRYIDADELLARYKERCAGCKFTPNHCEHFCDIADVISDIEDAPTEDIVEVVRCKDCKHHESIKMANGYLSFCRKHRLIDDLMSSDFCSDGERRKKSDETN